MLLPERKLLILYAKVTFFAVVMCDVSHIHNNHYDQRQLANQQQSSSNHEHHYHGQDGKYDSLNDGTGWDIRLSVPGEPDRDYPTLNSVPRTAFSCNGKNPGYYADPQTRCQVFRVCANTAPTGFFSFLCPNGTLFNQEVLVCDWWMNVRCVDTERYSKVNQALTVKSGLAMMTDIKKMIMYPMMHPYTAIFPQMRQTYQTYNPPEGMFTDVQRPLTNDVQTSELTNSFKLAMPFSTKKINNNRDSYSSGSTIGSTNQYQGAVPANHNPVYKESTSFFTRENFGGLSLQKSFDSSSNQGVKVTKQQFTYPSQYDKQYTVSAPKAPTSPSLVVHFPINVPAIDHNSGVSDKNVQQSIKSSIHNTSFIQKAETKLSKPLPLIVLLLQPPLEHSKYEQKSKISSDISSSTSSLSSFNESSSGFTKGSSNIAYTHPNHNYGNTQQNSDKMSSNASQFTANVASQTNFYITNNVVPNKNKFIPTDVENIPHKPTRLVADSNVQESSSKINITSFMDSLTNSSQIIDNNIDVDRNNLVTLFSAHLIPSGDVEKQRVLKICIPKDMLSFLLHLHNSTRAALEMSYQNSAQTNKTILFQGVPFIRKFMEKMLMKNSNSDLQVPIATAETLFESQKTINENYQKKQSEFNSNYESQYFASQNTKNNEGKISSTQFTNYEPQQSVQKQESTSKNQNFQSRYQSSDVKSFDSKISNAYKSNLNEKTNTNYQIASTLGTLNNPADFNVQNPENHSGGSFYSVQQSIYQNRKGSPNRIQEAKTENVTKENSFVSTAPTSGNSNQFEDYYNYGKFTNQNKSVNYSLQQNFQATKRIQTTVQTAVANSNSGYAESTGAFQSTKTHNGNAHNEGQLISVQQHSPLQIPQKPMPFTAPTPSGVSFQKEINYSSFHTAHSTPDNKQQQLKFEQFSQSVNKSPQRNPDVNVYRTNYIASSESTPSQQYSYSVTQQRAPTEQTVIKTHTYPNQVQSETSSVIYSSSGSSQNNEQPNQYSQYVSVPIKQNANLQYSNQQQSQNLIQNNNAPNYGPYPNQQTYSIPTQYPAQTQLEIQSNQKYEINTDKEHIGDYATVEVVPALGFAIDSIRERQDYYNALTKGLQSVQNEYLPPYTQQRVVYATNEKSYPNSQDDKYQTYNENYRQNGNTQYSEYNSQYGGQNRLVQGQIITHPQSQVNGQSLPLEDFGYSQQKPSVPFSY